MKQCRSVVTKAVNARLSYLVSPRKALVLGTRILGDFIIYIWLKVVSAESKASVHAVLEVPQQSISAADVSMQ